MLLSEVTDAVTFAQAIQGDDGARPVADNSAESIKAGFRAVIIDVIDSNATVAEKIKKIKTALVGMQKADDVIQQIARSNRPLSANPDDDKFPPKNPKVDKPRSVTTAEGYAAAVTNRSHLTEAERREFNRCIID